MRTYGHRFLRAMWRTALGRETHLMTQQPLTAGAGASPREPRDDATISGAIPSTVTTAQYSLPVVLGIWAAATVPMGLLAFVVAPTLIPRTSLHPGIVHWTCMVVGMVWQFVLSLLVLRWELGGLRWAQVRERIQWQGPRDPVTGRPRAVLFWWVLPAVVLNLAGGWLSGPLDGAWTALVPWFSEPGYTQIQGLIDPQFRGQWWLLGLALVSCVFNYVLGEELLFRGVLLPRMTGV